MRKRENVLKQRNHGSEEGERERGGDRLSGFSPRKPSQSRRSAAPDGQAPEPCDGCRSGQKNPGNQGKPARAPRTACRGRGSEHPPPPRGRAGRPPSAPAAQLK